MVFFLVYLFTQTDWLIIIFYPSVRFKSINQLENRKLFFNVLFCWTTDDYFDFVYCYFLKRIIYLKNWIDFTQMSIHQKMLTVPEVFAEYYAYNTVGHIFKDCGAICMREHMCSVSHLKSNDMHRCLRGEHLLFRHDPHLSSLFTEISRQADMTVLKDSSIMIGCIIALILICIIFVGLLFLRFVSKWKIQKYLKHGELGINESFS